MSVDHLPTAMVPSHTVKPGQRVYSADGTELGVVRGLTEDGFRVRLGEDVAALSLEHAPGGALGEGYVVWRCGDCGEMGALDAGGLPEACPGCGAGREALYVPAED